MEERIKQNEEKEEKQGLLGGLVEVVLVLVNNTNLGKFHRIIFQNTKLFPKHFFSRSYLSLYRVSYIWLFNYRSW